VKALLVLVAVLVGVWIWRQRHPSGSVGPTNRAKEPVLQDMVRCRQCGMHFPGAEAIIGKQGSYCCTEHLRLSES